MAMDVLYEEEEINKTKLKFSHRLHLTKLFSFMYYFLECRNYTLFFFSNLLVLTLHRKYICKNAI